jgi:hypothetical protein
MNKSWIRTSNDDWIANIAWGLGIVVMAIAATLARKLGWMDGEAVERMVIGANGLMIAWNGNRMPKQWVPSECARRFRRVGGWSMTLSGLVYAGLWAFAPLPVAFTWGTVAVVAGIGITIGYCVTVRRTTKAG